jgi:hypothetical protein
MPILPADVVLPVGRMPADWHTTPDIEAWIAQGYDTAPVEASEVQADGIATAYTYYRGYSARADTLLGSPDNVGLGDMSVAQSNGRYDRMVKQADVYRLEWESLIAAVFPAPVPEEPTLRVSGSTMARVVYVL